MKIAVRHATTYRYDQRANYSVQSLRLTPQPSDAQTILAWKVRSPGIEKAASFEDGFANIVHLVTISEPHDSITIEVEGLVETHNTAGVTSGLKEVAPADLFFRETVLTRPDDAIRALAAKAKGQGDLDRLHHLMAMIRERIAYRTGETHSRTTAGEALEHGSGVCQDHAHVFIAAARLLGFPARYISGYLWATEGEAGDAQHAWAEALVPDLGWVGFDVSNGISPDPHYVRIACGLDYDYAAPVRGSRRGGGGETLDVIVEVGEATAQQ